MRGEFRGRAEEGVAHFSREDPLQFGYHFRLSPVRKMSSPAKLISSSQTDCVKLMIGYMFQSMVLMQQEDQGIKLSALDAGPVTTRIKRNEDAGRKIIIKKTLLKKRRKLKRTTI